MRISGLISAILLFLASSALAELDFNPRRQPPQAVVAIQKTVTSQSGTQSLPGAVPQSTIIPEQKPVAGASDMGTTGRPAAIVAVLVTIAGVLFGLGMGV